MTDASTISYTPPGTGASATNVAAFLDDLPTDLAFSTLQAAVTAAAGKTLLVARAWTSSTTISVPSNTRIVGYGGSLTITSPGVNGLDLGGDQIVIENLSIIGPSSTSEPDDFTLGNGIQAISRTNVTIKGCVISGFNSCGVLLRGCNNWRVTDNLLFGNLYNSPRTVGEVSDICVYTSGGTAGKGTISNNFCMSNNSQGIHVNALGWDSDISIVGNVCVATTDGSTEASTTYRRHGIAVGYNQQAGGGRVAVVGNVIRNANSTGIYLASNTNLARAIVVSSNTISQTGMGTDPLQAALNGGITVLGGGAATLIASNAIYDFQGDHSALVGCINIDHQIDGASCTVEGNSCDTSSAHGIVLKGMATGVVVRGNILRNITWMDILEAPSEGSGYGGHVIVGNDCQRANDEHPCIYIGFGNSIVTTFVRGNKLTGANTTTNSFDNGGVRLQHSTTSKQVIVEENIFSKFKYAVSIENPISGRLFDLHRIDRNHFEDCYAGINIPGNNSAPCMPVEGNSFRNCTNKTHGGGYADCAYIARRSDMWMTLLALNAAPSTGTWNAGDRAEFTAPASGTAPGAVCTAGGNPGTWKAQASLA